MNYINLLIKLIKLILQYGVFENEDFEFTEIDDRPNFYLGIFTLRPKE